MNETLKTIFERRSVRRFNPEPIADDTLRLIAEAGANAPSAMNEQPWLFIAVKTEETRRKIFEACGGEGRFYSAPEVLLVFSHKTAVAPIQDASLAIENMLLAAASLDVAACWIHSPTHFFAEPQSAALRRELCVPEDYLCVGSFVLGKNAGDTPAAKPRRNDYLRIV